MNPSSPNPQLPPPLPNDGMPYPPYPDQQASPYVSNPAPQQAPPMPPSVAFPPPPPGGAEGLPSPQPSYNPNQAAGTPVQSMPPQPPGKAPVTPVHTNPNSTQNALQIAEIRDGIVIMNDGSFRSVIMVKSINFDLMSQGEQEAVEFSYQGFLNSLYFPIQIFIRSQKVDLQPYIAKLDKIRTEHDNMLLAMIMEDYIGYIDALSQQTNIMDKKFYVVIPFIPQLDVQKALAGGRTFFSGLSGIFSSKEHHITINEADLEKAKTELRNRVQATLASLQQCGVQGLPLDTQELIELYYDTYNPDTATRQQLKNFNELSGDVVTKGQGVAPQAHLQRELN